MNILLTSVGRRSYMIDYFKLSMRGIGKVYASNSILTNTLLRADGYVLTPKIYDINYIGFLIDFCKSMDVNAIISLFDIDLPILAKNRLLFEENGIKLVVSDYHVVQICNDKWKTYQFLRRVGINQPQTYISLCDARKSIKDGVLTFPIFIKPRWGMGSIGIYRIESDEELFVLYKKLRREIFETYLKYESSNNEDSCILIQQGISGQEYGLEILNDLELNYIKTFAKKKIAMRAGETDVAVTVSPVQFEDVGRVLSKNLKHMALLDVDCIIDESNNLYVLEMNCRFGGQYPFTHNSGVNVPLQIIKWLSGKSVDFSILNQKDGVVSCKEISPTIMTGVQSFNLSKC